MKQTPERKAYLDAWRERNKDHVRRTKRAWNQKNPGAVMSSLLKRLKPEDSLFPVFTPLDATPGFERHVAFSNGLCPSTLLMLKEEALLRG